jgi:hypothetical protein
MHVFPVWHRAQRAVDRHAREAPPPPSVLRATGFLRRASAEHIARWYLEPPAVEPSAGVRRSYRALERDTARLYGVACRELGVRVRLVRCAHDPYDSAEELCDELRRRGTMSLRTIACDRPHPLLGGAAGGVVDRLRVVHDVFGHAALGLGFDLQSEFATWLQCRALFSRAARPAAFCELVGAVTAYVGTGVKPPLQAKLPPAGLLPGPVTRDVMRDLHGREPAGSGAGSAHDLHRAAHHS